VRSAFALRPAIDGYRASRGVCRNLDVGRARDAGLGQRVAPLDPALRRVPPLARCVGMATSAALVEYFLPVAFPWSFWE
jgi:hypothetical protein